jgi:hypothetical protein
MMERDLVFDPLPQVLVQSPYADQLETWQLTGQPKVLQVVEEERAGHATPPFAATVSTERDLVFLPVPQDWVQEL